MKFYDFMKKCKSIEANFIPTFYNFITPELEGFRLKFRKRVIATLLRNRTVKFCKITTYVILKMERFF